MTKHIKGGRRDIALQALFYAHERKIKHLTELVSILWKESRGSAPGGTCGLVGVWQEECTDGDWTFEKPEHLDCCTLADDLGCQTLDEKPETVPDEEPTP